MSFTRIMLENPCGKVTDAVQGKTAGIPIDTKSIVAMSTGQPAGNFKYWAFISYSHADARIGRSGCTSLPHRIFVRSLWRESVTDSNRNSMLADLLQPIGEALFELAFYFLGRLIVPLISFGNWSCEPLLSRVPKHKTRWGGLLHLRGRRVYFTSEGTAAVGGLFCLLAAGACALIWFLSH